MINKIQKIIRDNKSLNIGVQLKRSTYVQFYGMQLKDVSESELEELSVENGVKVVINRNGTLFRMGVRSGYLLSEINNIKILNTSDLKPFEKENIFQITFIDLNGEKEKLVLQSCVSQVHIYHCLNYNNLCSQGIPNFVSLQTSC